jgi:hypothetical protein
MRQTALFELHAAMNFVEKRQASDFMFLTFITTEP